MKGCEFVFHLAASADVRFGQEHACEDLQEQNAIATFNVLEAMRANGITGIAFSSTGSIYGKVGIPDARRRAVSHPNLPLWHELAQGRAHQKLIAKEYQFEGYIFRFVSILGERYTHDHVFDFYKQLLEHPIAVLGDGAQHQILSSRSGLSRCDLLLWSTRHTAADVPRRCKSTIWAMDSAGHRLDWLDL